MTITTRPVEYTLGGKTFEGMLAIDSTQDGPRPVVLVAHQWSGRSDFEIDVTKKLAGLGYAGFAIDLYGKGILGKNKEENTKLLTPFMQDRAMLQTRMNASLETALAQPETNPNKAAAIGYCFGGLSVLDLARMGAKVEGVVSFHGLFHPPGNCEGKKITAKILALHGWDDPMAKPEDAVALAAELSKAGADWQLHAYGNTLHAFTHPNANDPENGTQFDASADRRSWTACTEFLAETLR